ncbi:hypothetical protein EZV62_028291 [Acer yangbiense]|uniref:non-specific serine/threonine protein kinase n=1 Tax=Acer yangbiense TaxID=1000413 RepID=A0A5C7GNP7_9ROSI|nr:hypothetical protein EZV62_028291 [Acer yangbiense]
MDLLLSFFFIIITLLFVHVPTSVLAYDDKYDKCSAPFQCGNMNISYPFWGEDRSEYCGYPGFKVDCNSDVPEINIAGRIYRVLKIDSPSKKVIVAIQDYWDNNCPKNSGNSPLNFTIFNYSPDTRNITLYYGCPVSSANEILPYRFNCSPVEPNSNTANYFLITSEYFGSCASNVQISVSGSTIQSIERYPYPANLTEVVRNGFGLQWNANNSLCDSCQQSNGLCGHDSDNSEFICYCTDQPHPYVCPNKGKRKLSRGAVGGIAAGGSAAVLIIVVVFVLVISMCMKICLPCKLMFFWREQTLNDQDVEALVKTYGSLAPKRYNYSDIKKMTNSFAVKLGQGGYGVVYRGKLNDGRIVAIKVLSKSKGNGEEFINEVACISRTSHVNIVGLLGFCYEGTRRALIYEFMPNGSLNTNLHLEWETLNKIVVGVARGLEYLHRGCNIRIVHFDIKPHNILLDEDFCPKISDFGLAKICKKKESIISMLDARGTIGYTAPEVFCRNFGGVSHKSDVYGFGMMVLEMVGVRQRTAGDHESNTSETYFPDWIYKQIEGSNDLTVDGIINEEERAIARKMILVSLWCIQTNPSDRPAMSKALEMLEGSVQSLQVPPKPFLQHSSPRSFQLYSSTTSTSLSRISSQQG